MMNLDEGKVAIYNSSSSSYLISVCSVAQVLISLLPNDARTETTSANHQLLRALASGPTLSSPGKRPKSPAKIKRKRAVS
ncbi:hypothetical protein L915_16897 [Phytophthora nicotianae]|uniref:Uncharacterized protein n=1 Tax=Phytophthora nicotianae TaxID=4792 RepID=W2G1E9_PHYNI|nr:hypothetical protein L915_16897 [Phytophthora nicotianae]